MVCCVFRSTASARARSWDSTDSSVIEPPQKDVCTDIQEVRGSGLQAAETARFISEQPAKKMMRMDPQEVRGSWLQAAETVRFHLSSNRAEIKHLHLRLAHGSMVASSCNSTASFVFDLLYTNMGMDLQKVCGPCLLEAATAQHNPFANG